MTKQLAYLRYHRWGAADLVMAEIDTLLDALPMPAAVLDEAGAALAANAAWQASSEAARARATLRPLGGGRRLALVAPDDAELRDARRRQRALLDSIPDIAWLKDAEGRFLAVNKPFAHSAGVADPDTLEGKTDLDVWQRELAERYRADDRRVMATGRQTRVEEPLVRGDGAEVWIETIKVPILDEQGAVIGTVGIARDITERREAERLRARLAAEENHRRLAAILEATTDFVGIAGIDLSAQYLNRAGRRLIGLGDDEPIGHLTVRDFHPPWAQALVVEQAIPTALRDGVWRGETALRTRDGREIPTSQVIAVLRDAEGRPDGLAAISRDITEIKSLQDRLLQSQKLEAMGRLAGGVAHDFNNLLTVMNAGVVFAKRTLPPGHAAHAELAQIGDAAQRAAALTGQLLSFARRQVVEATAVDLNRLVLGADTILRRLLGENVELVTLVAPQLDLVRVDPAQFEQVILNLAINARDAMPEGGTLSIETRVVEAGADGPVAPGRWVMLRVSDTGTGIAEEALPHLFEPFFTTKARGRGTGLGLATCYGIVQQAQGQIRVETAPGAGSTFAVYLPSAGPPGAASVAGAAERATSGHETVLLVEDEPQVRAAAIRALAERGYTVLPAASGADALSVAERHRGPIHLVVTDVVMPHMSGPQLVEELRRMRPGLTVLYVSGYAAGEMSHGHLLDGMHFLPKPFTPDGLARRVRELLDEEAARGVVPLWSGRR